MIDFARPTALLLLLIVPALVGLARRDARKRAGEWVALGRTGAAPPDGTRAEIAAISLLIVALAGPRFGHDRSDPATGREVVLLIDVSRSMAARDAVPDRLGAAVEAAEELVSALGGETATRAAVVAFSGRGVLRCPLTENLGAAAAVLGALRPGEVRPGGTDLAAGLEAALDAFPDHEPDAGRAVVVFSDGEDLAGAWDRLVPRLKERGIPVHAVAVGDDAAAGQPIPLGDGGELTYRGAPVRTRRWDQALAAVARATGGAFIPLGLSPPDDLGALFVSRIEPASRRAHDPHGPDGGERYAPLVLAAMGMILVGNRPRRRRFRLAAGLVLVVIAGAGPSSQAVGRRLGSANEALRLGAAAVALGRDDDALAWFLHAAALEPENPLPAYNAGSVLFRLGRYAEARRQYLSARGPAGAELRVKIDFALGNTAFGLGDIPAAIGYYDTCLASTAPGADAAATRRDAAVNREFVAARRREQAPPEVDDSAGSTPRPAEDSPTRSDQANGSELPGPSTSGPGPAPVETRDREPERSPAERLESALDHVRDARSRRLPDPPAPEADPERKDW